MRLVTIYSLLFTSTRGQAMLMNSGEGRRGRERESEDGRGIGRSNR
jgi:hypothetical protein